MHLSFPLIFVCRPFLQPVVAMLDDVKRAFLQEHAAKGKARDRAASLEERLKALEEENASLKLAAENERSAKDRLLAVVHSLTGLFPSFTFRFCILWCFSC